MSATALRLSSVGFLCFMCSYQVEKVLKRAKLQKTTISNDSRNVVTVHRSLELFCAYDALRNKDRDGPAGAEGELRGRGDGLRDPFDLIDRLHDDADRAQRRHRGLRHRDLPWVELTPLAA